MFTQVNHVHGRGHHNQQQQPNGMVRVPQRKNGHFQYILAIKIRFFVVWPPSPCLSRFCQNSYLVRTLPRWRHACTLSDVLHGQPSLLRLTQGVTEKVRTWEMIVVSINPEKLPQFQYSKEINEFKKSPRIRFPLFFFWSNNTPPSYY